MTRLLIVLPHSPRELSPNARVPFSPRGAAVANKKKVAAKRRARTMAWAVTLKVLNGETFVPDSYSVRWFYKGPEPDDDNVLTRCKYYKDGACAAMGIDDRVLSCKGIERVHDLARAGEVEVVFEKDEYSDSCRTCVHCRSGMIKPSPFSDKEVEGHYCATPPGTKAMLVSGIDGCCGKYQSKKGDQNDA